MNIAQLVRRARPVLLLLLGAGWLGTATAAGPAGGPEYQNVGKIYLISFARGTAVIDDRQYKLASNLKVYSGGKVLTGSALSAGITIGFNSVDDGSNIVLTEAWLAR